MPNWGYRFSCIHSQLEVKEVAIWLVFIFSLNTYLNLNICKIDADMDYEVSWNTKIYGLNK